MCVGKAVKILRCVGRPLLTNEEGCECCCMLEVRVDDIMVARYSPRNPKLNILEHELNFKMMFYFSDVME